MKKNPLIPLLLIAICSALIQAGYTAYVILTDPLPTSWATEADREEHQEEIIAAISAKNTKQNQAVVLRRRKEREARNKEESHRIKLLMKIQEEIETE